MTTPTIEEMKEKVKRYHLQAEQHHTTVLKTRRHYRASMNDLLKIFEQTITTLQSHHEETVKKAREEAINKLRAVTWHSDSVVNVGWNKAIEYLEMSTPITNNQA